MYARIKNIYRSHFSVIQFVCKDAIFYLNTEYHCTYFLSIECPDTVPATGLNGSLPTCTDDTQCPRAGDKCCTVTTGGSGKVCIKAGNLFIQAANRLILTCTCADLEGRSVGSGTPPPLENSNSLYMYLHCNEKKPTSLFGKQKYHSNPNPPMKNIWISACNISSFVGKSRAIINNKYIQCKHNCIV